MHDTFILKPRAAIAAAAFILFGIALFACTVFALFVAGASVAMWWSGGPSISIRAGLFLGGAAVAALCIFAAFYILPRITRWGDR